MIKNGQRWSKMNIEPGLFRGRIFAPYMGGSDIAHAFVIRLAEIVVQFLWHLVSVRYTSSSYCKSFCSIPRLWLKRNKQNEDETGSHSSTPGSKYFVSQRFMHQMAAKPYVTPGLCFTTQCLSICVNVRQVHSWFPVPGLIPLRSSWPWFPSQLDVASQWSRLHSVKSWRVC